MRLIAGIVNSVTRPFVRAWRWALGVVPPMSDAPAGLVPRAWFNVGFFRTLTAPGWRTLVRWTVVAVGFCLYISLQLVLAYMVNQLMWEYIVAFFVAMACLVLAVSRPTLAFILWLVLSPLGFIFLRMDFGAGMPAITFDRVALSALAGFLILRTMMERHRVKKPIVGEWLTLAFIGYTCVALYVMQPGSLKTILGTISEKFDHIGLALIVYYIAKSVLVTRRHLNWIVIGLVITGLYVAVSAFYEHYTGNQWFSSFLGGNYSLAYGDVEKGRAAGPLLNPAAMGTFLGITAFLSFHLFAATERKTTKAFYLASMVAQLIGCYFCLTRSGYVSALLLFALMPFFTTHYRKQYAAASAAAVLVAIIGLPILLSNADVANRMSKTSTVLGRIVITASTINIIKHYPVFGVGLGEIDNALQQYVTNAGTLSGLIARGGMLNRYQPQGKLIQVLTSHNSILTICAEQGLIGGALFVGALIAFVIHLFGVRARLPDEGLLGKDFVTLLIIAIIGHTASTCGYDIRFFKYPSYFLWVLFAIGVRLGEITAEEHESEPVEQLVTSEPAGGLVHA